MFSVSLFEQRQQFFMHKKFSMEMKKFSGFFHIIFYFNFRVNLTNFQFSSRLFLFLYIFFNNVCTWLLNLIILKIEKNTLRGIERKLRRMRPWNIWFEWKSCSFTINYANDFAKRLDKEMVKVCFNKIYNVI